MSTIFNNIGVPASYQTQPQATVEKAQTTQPIVVKEAIAAAPQAKEDTIEISNKDKKGPIKTVKGWIANFKKFFATTGEYIKGTAKGLTSGIVAGSVVYTAGAAVNGVRQGLVNHAAKKSGEVAKVVKKIPNKFLAGIVAVGALALNIWNASLNATEKQSEIEHRWTGHN